MGIANRGKFSNELDKSIDKVFYDALGDGSVEKEYMYIAKVETPEMGDSIVESEISGLGNLQLLAEAGRVEYDIPEEGNKKSRGYHKAGLGFVITEEMIEDGVHKTIMQAPKSLADSAIHFINQYFYNLFNNGFDSEVAWDGEYIFDTDHETLKSGDTINNDLTAAALSETTLGAMFEYFDDLVNNQGQPAPRIFKTLLIPSALRKTAWSLAYGDRVLGSSNNDLLSTNKKTGLYSGWEPVVSHYLTDDNAFFGLANDHDFRLVFKKTPTLDKSTDFDTDVRKYKMVTRFATFCNKYAGGVGNAGA